MTAYFSFLTSNLKFQFWMPAVRAWDAGPEWTDFYFSECTPQIRRKYHSWEARQREKCENLDISDSFENLEITGANEHSPWKAAFLRKRRIEQAWKSSQVNARELVGHDDHVVTCLQFDGNRIVSGSDDNTLKVNNIFLLLILTSEGF